MILHILLFSQKICVIKIFNNYLFFKFSCISTLRHLYQLCAEYRRKLLNAHEQYPQIYSSRRREHSDPERRVEFLSRERGTTDEGWMLPRNARHGYFRRWHVAIFFLLFRTHRRDAANAFDANACALAFAFGERR